MKLIEKTRYEKPEGEVTARIFSGIVKEEQISWYDHKKKKKPALSTENQKIKQLKDRRNELRKKKKQKTKTKTNNKKKKKKTGQ